MHVSELQTPALVIDADALEHNLRTMAEALPGSRCRPHVKAHKCTSLARRQYEAGHHTFTCATIREVEGMAAAGLGDDLLLANEVVHAERLGRVVAGGKARVTLAVDSEATIEAAAAGGVREIVIDVNVGLPRCGCNPEDAGRLAEVARARGLEVRGVMGYEGHVVGLEDRGKRTHMVAGCMELLLQAYDAVGGELMSAGGTGTYDINTFANEIQAGSYVLMDTAYDKLELPFRQALFAVATVISVAPGGWVVADAGLKCFGMDHGNPSLADGGSLWFCSDEHVTYAPPEGTTPRVGDLVRLIPAHVDPTIAYHDQMHVVDGDEVVESWPVDLRGW